MAISTRITRLSMLNSPISNIISGMHVHADTPHDSLYWIQSYLLVIYAMHILPLSNPSQVCAYFWPIWQANTNCTGIWIWTLLSPQCGLNENYREDSACSLEGATTSLLEWYSQSTLNLAVVSNLTELPITFALCDCNSARCCESPTTVVA